MLQERFQTALGESVLHRKLPFAADGGGGRSSMGLSGARGYCTSPVSRVAGPSVDVPSTIRSFGSSSRFNPTPYNASHVKNRLDGGRSGYTSMTMTVPFDIHMGRGGLGKDITSVLKKSMTTRTMGMCSRRAVSSFLLRRPCC